MSIIDTKNNKYVVIRDIKGVLHYKTEDEQFPMQYQFLTNFQKLRNEKKRTSRQ